MRAVVGDPEIDSPADRNAAARRLIIELNMEGVAAEAPTTVAEPGSKPGTALVLGELVVQGLLSTATVTAIARVVIAFVRRGAARKVEFTRGDEKIVIEGISATDQMRALEEWLRLDRGHSDSPE